MTLPRWDSVAALYCRQKSMMLTPCGPRAVPTGGAGVAAPALSCTLTTAAIFFLLGAIGGPVPASCFLFPGCPRPRSDLGDLVERQLDRCLPAEDRHEHLELLGVGVDLAHGGWQRRERTVHHRNGFAHLVFHRQVGDLGLRRLLLRFRCEQGGHLGQAERRRPDRKSTR